MFSLCIPTMDRFDQCLIKYLHHYINNDLIDEIIICDENGNDVYKINQHFPLNEKLKLYVNAERHGPFYNKMKCCKLANNEWIALIDSDNFADVDYFQTIHTYIVNNMLEKNTILSPDYASEVFQWKHLSNIPNNVINKDTFKKMKEYDEMNSKNKTNVGVLSHLMNVGNYVLKKYIVENIDVDTNKSFNSTSYSFDVLLFNYLCFSQLNMSFILVKDAKYQHVASDDSVYLQYCNQQRTLAANTYIQLWKVLNNTFVQIQFKQMPLNVYIYDYSRHTSYFSTTLHINLSTI